ncbi:hypothetical protein HOK51_02155 [Candidatus Woesearchaeota archaeon]|nr:hypothetical protein [Candidatus Woesearchaeota archaeon]MBT6518619.1 hypothetical protein [Candidatus Woesearchaeota archaeon]
MIQIVDIDKVRKINDLARDLLRHGMVKSMSEAVQMAEKQLSQAIDGIPSVTTNINPEPVVAQETKTEAQNVSPEHSQVMPTQESQSTELSTEPATTTDPTNTEPTTTQQNSESTDLILKTTVSIVNTHSDKLTQMEEHVSHLKQQIEFLKQEVTRLSKNPIEVLSTESKETTQSKENTDAQQEAQTTFKPQPTPPKPAPNPRSGNYNSEDVDIEKFFYSGPK